MTDNFEPAFVLDAGTGVIKCGFAGEEVPRGVFAGVIGYPKGSPNGPYTVGDKAIETKGLSLKYPAENGIVTDWDAMELVWRAAYESCGVKDPSERPILITEAPMNPKKNREKMLEVMFEKFGVPGLAIQTQAILTLYSVGRVTGCVLDSGDGVTHAIPVYESFTDPVCHQRIDIAGRDMTEWMMELLTDETDVPFTTTAHREIARNVKEKLSYVAQDFEAFLEKAGLEEGNPQREEMVAPYQLPDGKELKLCRSLFCCPEALFDPTLMDRNTLGIHHLVNNAIMLSSVDNRRHLYRNIVLSGGNTMFKGLETRLESEIKSLANAVARDDVKVIAPNERKFSVWIGAAILASLMSFETEWILKSEYEEHGPSIVHNRNNAHGFVGK
eukprot:Tbor_TRINITY_DN4792_c0_g1::TRINITY_DN4792_c0_g1_i1::g.16994::m.16994/K05692/ACTB_G1; actin beta/gamma 1